MLAKIWDYIDRNHMIEQGDRIVVGVSGGADSVCLLYALLQLREQLRMELFVVHINHGIRGEEADEDERFVERLCSLYPIHYFPYYFDVKNVAAKKGISEEEAGRMVRYETFLQVCREQQCNKIAVAHNKNDNAETFLFHLFRGTGLKGLSGIEPTRSIVSGAMNIIVIRPLLCLERKEIEGFLEQKEQIYRIDSTNLTEDYSRNKIRNKILTYAVAEINSGAVGNINDAAYRIMEALEYVEAGVTERYNSLVKQEGATYRIPVLELVKEPVVIQKGIIRRILENLAGSLKDLGAKHMEAVISLYDKQVGRSVRLPYDIIVEREYNDIKFIGGDEHSKERFPDNTMETVLVKIPGETVLPGNRKILKASVMKYEKSEPIPKSSCVKWFDYDKIENAVEIRNRKEGDYIQINAFGGNKKLKDYFIDHKLPRKLRDSQILIADGNHIMWIPGDVDRISEKYKVEDTTSNVLLMKLIDLEE